MRSIEVDTLIFGGGAAGLWLLDDLRRHGNSAVLLEAGQLGRGQTIASQGIIHGGLKYTLQGLLTPSAEQIREMPGLWRDCLAGESEPNLSSTRLRSDCCHLWRTDSVRSRLGMIGAKFGLRVAPNELPIDERPEILRQCPGTVARLDEQVISPKDFLTTLAERNREAILRIDPTQGLSFQVSRPGEVNSVVLQDSAGCDPIQFRPVQIVFTAGRGNEELRQQVGLATSVMQKRPLHMVMLRGDLPVLNGHCVDGARTRVTITSDRDSAGRTVWQVGGQIAEDGVEREPAELMSHAVSELLAVLPGLSLDGVEFAAYRVVRAEATTRNGRRPDQVQVLRDGNVVTAWPTKLALVPKLTAAITTELKRSSIPQPTLPADWTRPQVASFPWEICDTWQRIEQQPRPAKRAA